MIRNYTLLLMLVSTLLSGCTAAVVGGVAAGISVVHDRRSTTVFLEDKEIQVNAYKILSAHDDINHESRVSISVFNHQVLLAGTTTTAEASNKLARLVAELPKVRKVFNQLSVGQPDLSTEAKDLYLGSKAKLALFSIDIEKFDPTRVDITTISGTVYLMGLLTKQESQAVIEKIRHLKGVKRVVTLFDYY